MRSTYGGRVKTQISGHPMGVTTTGVSSRHPDWLCLGGALPPRHVGHIKDIHGATGARLTRQSSLHHKTSRCPAIKTVHTVTLVLTSDRILLPETPLPSYATSGASEVQKDSVGQCLETRRRRRFSSHAIKRPN